MNTLQQIFEIVHLRRNVAYHEAGQFMEAPVEVASLSVRLSGITGAAIHTTTSSWRGTMHFI